MRYLAKNTSGLSLVELLVVMAMLGVIMGAVYSLVISNQRTAYTSDETVEVQQNLRIAMDTISKDLRMAGMFEETSSIIAVINDNGPKDVTADLIPGPERGGSDELTMNMLSASGVFARVDADITPGSSSASFLVAPATTVDSPVTAASVVSSVGDGDVLQVGDVVRIFRPSQRNQPSSDSAFTVTEVVRQVGLRGPSTPPTTAPSVKLENTTGATMSAVEFKRGDMLVRVNTVASGLTIRYAVVSNVPTDLIRDPSCPVNQRCLARFVNGGASEIVAQNIADFQLRYILDDGEPLPNPTDTPPDLTRIKAVIVTIWGETQTTRLLSNDVPKIRQLSSVVKLRNRR